MPEPIPVNPPTISVLPYQFHQAAIFTSDVDHSANEYIRLGFGNWIRDEAELKGILWGEPVITKALMLFNYDIMPMELEFLSYRGPSRHTWRIDEGDFTPFISHMSAYVDDVIQSTRDLIPLFGLPFHRFITQNHTNPGVVGKKRFIESIFDTRDDLGYDLKLIQKVPWDYDDDIWLKERF